MKIKLALFLCFIALFCRPLLLHAENNEWPELSDGQETEDLLSSPAAIEAPDEQEGPGENPDLLPDVGTDDEITWNLDSDGVLTFTGNGAASFGSLFAGNPDIKKVVFAEGITRIDSPGMFRNCRNLQTVSLPETMTFIADRTFSECESLSSITLPKAVTSVGSRAFYNCFNLTTIVAARSSLSASFPKKTLFPVFGA